MSPQANPVTRNQATIHRRSNYLEAANATLVALRKGITNLRIKLLDTSLSLAAQAEIGERIAELEQELNNVESQIMAFHSNQAAVQPPDAGELKAIKQLSVNLFTMTANAVAVSVILGAVSQLLTAWNQIQ